MSIFNRLKKEADSQLGFIFFLPHNSVSRIPIWKNLFSSERIKIRLTDWSHTHNIKICTVV